MRVVTVAGSASPHIVPAPHSAAAAVDPEEAFVASLSACHMLWFLHLARDAGYVVASYRDAAEGVMAKNADGKLAMTKVTLKPYIVFKGNQPSPQDVDHLHHRAHEECFIANCGQDRSGRRTPTRPAGRLRTRQGRTRRMADAYIFDAVRTPRGKGKKDGSLARDHRPVACDPGAGEPARPQQPRHPRRSTTWSWLRLAVGPNRAPT
jgi:organic hydroperoxide reductase OsmC/OhrA